MRKHQRDRGTKWKWAPAVQRTVNQVVAEFYRSDPHQRTGLRVLELIGKNWTATPSLFEGTYDYYEALLKTTDHLLQGLLQDRDSHSIVIEAPQIYAKKRKNCPGPLLVCKKTSQSCVLRTYWVEIPCEVENLQSIAWGLYSAIQEPLPDRLEVVHVLSGRRTRLPIKSPSHSQSVTLKTITEGA